MKANYNRRKFFKVSGAAAAGGAATLAGINYSFAGSILEPTGMSLEDYSPYHRNDLQNVPVYDFHTHLRDTPLNATSQGMDEEVKAQVALMDELNVRKTTILCIGKISQRLAYEYLKREPERFVVYTDLDFTDMNHRKWSEKMVKHVEESVQLGARGLKFWLGPRGQENAMALDDPRLDPVYRKAAELNLPIATHCNDPEEFFYPPNRFNFWCGAEYIKEKGFSHRVNELVSRETIVRQIENMLTKNPDTTFILVHMAFLSRQLALLADILDRHPNAYLDLSAAVEELGRSPKESAAFMTYYADRILFGTDGNNSTPWNAFRHRHFIALETNLDNIQGPYRRSWNIHGMNLPKEVLEKIYYKNAEAMLARGKE